MKRKEKAARVLGIDYGLARIGLALSDEMQIIATPLQVFPCEKKLSKTVDKLARYLEEHQKEQGYKLQTIVIGMPLLMSGKVGIIADEVNHFAEQLRSRLDVPHVFWDERLTSAQADRSMRESGMTRRQRSKIVDTVAAVIILQNYLDNQAFQRI